MKWYVKAILICVTMLVASWAIGRAIHGGFVDSSETNVAEDTSDVSVDSGVACEQNTWNGYNIEFEGATSTDENPFKCTACVAEDEERGRYVFLTPNTGFIIKDLDENTNVSIQAQIHPWVAASSDGAGIEVWIMDANDAILQKDSVIISNDDKWTNFKYSLEQFSGAKKIKFLCNNGTNDNDICDWVIFR